MGSELNRLMQLYGSNNGSLAQTLGAMGRRGDSLVAHITPKEAMTLKAMGGAGTVNPLTGLLEFYDADGNGNATDSSDPSGSNSSGDWGGGDWGGGVTPSFNPGSISIPNGVPGSSVVNATSLALANPNITTLDQMLTADQGFNLVNSFVGGPVGLAGSLATGALTSMLGSPERGAETPVESSASPNNASGGYTQPTVNTANVTATPAASATPAVTTTPTANAAPATSVRTATGGVTPSYGFELNRLMQIYGVNTPSMLPYGGQTSAQTDSARYAYDQKAYQDYAKEYQNRLMAGNMYNQAQFMPDPTKYVPQNQTPVGAPIYSPGNFADINTVYNQNLGRAPETAAVQYWGNTGLTGDQLKNAVITGAQNEDADFVRRKQIADIYSKYFGRPVEEAGVDYWLKTGLLNDDLKRAITIGAQNSDADYFRTNFPNYQYAKGGRVNYAEGGEVEEDREGRSSVGSMSPDQARRYRELMTRYLPSTNYGPQLAAAQQTARSEADAFSNMIRQMSERAESPTSRAEMYFRLASAFGAPTRTGQFTENLALAGREMGEVARGRRADEAERRALGLRAQELRMAGARQDLASLQALANQESAERRAIMPKIIEAEIRANAPNARENRINDVMQTLGIGRPLAVGIVDNIITVVPGSAGEPPVLINRATGEIIPTRMGAAPVVGTPPAGQPAEQPPVEQPAVTPSAPTVGEIPAVNLRRQQAAPTTPAAPGSVEDFYAGRRQRDVQQAGQTAEAQARGQAVVRREDQPARVEEAGQTAEAQARGRSTVETETEERKRRRGQEMIESVLRDMMRSYGRLDELGGIPSESRTTMQNVPAYLAGTGVGQEVGRALATQTQTQRNQIQASVRQLLTAIKNATGMSAQEMNSNVELQSLLDAVSNPRQSIESVRGILTSISRQYGLGELTPPEPTPPREQTQEPRRRGAATTTPTLEQFLAAARRANPNVSDEALTDYYNRTYGGR